MASTSVSVTGVSAFTLPPVYSTCLGSGRSAASGASAQETSITTAVKRIVIVLIVNDFTKSMIYRYVNVPFGTKTLLKHALPWRPVHVSSVAG